MKERICEYFFIKLHSVNAVLIIVHHSAKLNEKYSIMTPFNVINKMLGPQLFAATARETLGDKMELYFHDHSFMPLFMQVRIHLL